MPEWIQINSIDASPHDAGTAYVAATAYKPTITDRIFTKRPITANPGKKSFNGIPNDAFTRVVREDPNRKGFLYAGTETGMYYSANDGETWHSLQLNLPIVPITDLAVHKREKDLVVATQGRSFYVLDNLAAFVSNDRSAARRRIFVQTRRRLPHGGRRRFSASAPTRRSARIRRTARSLIII
jgi:hypothetical protein